MLGWRLAAPCRSRSRSGSGRADGAPLRADDAPLHGMDGDRPACLLFLCGWEMDRMLLMRQGAVAWHWDDDLRDQKGQWPSKQLSKCVVVSRRYVKPDSADKPPTIAQNGPKPKTRIKQKPAPPSSQRGDGPSPALASQAPPLDDYYAAICILYLGLLPKF